MRYELLLIAPVAFVACNNDHSLGSSTAPSDGNDASAPGLLVDARLLTMTPDARALGEVGPVTSWTGYVENYQFPSGSDVIKLAYTYDSAGQVTGSVVFGDGVPPAPATDPNVGYPPGLGMEPFSYAPTEGFSFSIPSGTLASNRLRFGIEVFELWDGWCKLQPAPSDDSNLCVPSWSGGYNAGACYMTSPAGKYVTIDCGKFSLCFMNRVCTCSPVGCIVPPGPDVRFDMFVTDGTASGSVAGALGEHNVHFIKDP
jgi:hypothetical protein